MSSIPWSGSFGGKDDGPLTGELDEQVNMRNTIYSTLVLALHKSELQMYFTATITQYAIFIQITLLLICLAACFYGIALLEMKRNNRCVVFICVLELFS